MASQLVLQPMSAHSKGVKIVASSSMF
jgi:hypothetical protein